MIPDSYESIENSLLATCLAVLQFQRKRERRVESQNAH